jgi:hypothetical protein
MSCIEAAFELVWHLTRSGDTTVDDGIRQLREGSAETATLDYAAGQVLMELVGRDALSRDDLSVRRQILRLVIDRERPSWRLAAARGRKWCLDAVDDDTGQILSWAGLTDVAPDDEAVRWWDDLASEVRGIGNAARLTAGRDGERLSMEYEQERLQKAGIDNRIPRWRALDDNTLGYDIESWDLIEGEIVPLRIEVKSFAGTQAQFFLSREEWDAACRFSDTYFFDVWDLNMQRLQRLPMTTLVPWIPTDTRAIEWRRSLVTVAGLSTT